MHANKALSIPWHGPFIAAGLWRNRKALAKKKKLFTQATMPVLVELTDSWNKIKIMYFQSFGWVLFLFLLYQKLRKRPEEDFHARSFMFCVTARPRPSTAITSSFWPFFCHGILLESATVSGKGTLESQFHQSLAGDRSVPVLPNDDRGCTLDRRVRWQKGEKINRRFW